MSSGLILDPAGQTVLVTITAASSGASISLYSDINCTAAQSNPLTITSRTVVYVKEDVQASVSLKIDGTEVATAAGSAASYTFEDQGVGSISPALSPLNSSGLVTQAHASATYAPLASPLLTGTPQINGVPVRGSLPDGYAFNLLPANYKKWRTALAKVRAGTAHAKLLCIGDSTTHGYGGSGNPPSSGGTSWPSRLTALLNTYHAPAQNGFGIIPTNPDTRWTLTNWAAFGAPQFGFGNKALAYLASGGSGTLAFAPGITADTFELMYPVGAGNGSVTVNVDGGATLATINQAGTTGISKTVVSPSSGTHTLNVVGSAVSGSVWMHSIEGYLNTTKSIRVANAGAGGSRTSDWVQNSSAAFSSLAAVEAWAPDLTVIQLGVNDAGGAVANATTIANLQTLITAAQLSGDVLLVAPFTPADGPTRTLVNTLVPLVSSLATTNSVGFVDIYDRWGGFSAYDTYNALGWYFDGTHPNEVGYADAATTIFEALRVIG